MPYETYKLLHVVGLLLLFLGMGGQLLRSGSEPERAPKSTAILHGVGLLAMLVGGFGMMARLGDRVHFLHMRNVARESGDMPCSFHEAEHLGGDTDMVALVEAALKEEAHRKAAGRADWSIPFRPDHGQDILDDLKRKAQPGYPAIGRLKGLAELRGVMTALEHSTHGLRP